LTDLGGGSFEGVLPVLSAGDEPEYCFSAQGDGGTTVTSPYGAPGACYAFDVGVTYPIMMDNFETDLGWTVQSSNLSTGEWERVDPIGTDYNGTPAQPEDDNPSGTGTLCYITENGSVGGSVGEADVDGGPTRLFSPVIDLSVGDAVISYYQWYYNDDGDDAFEVDVSNDNGTNWTNVTSSSSGSRWLEKSFRVSDYVAPSAQVKVRFSASDNPNNSITEAGVDDFSVNLIDTDPALCANAYTLSASAGCDILLFVMPGPSYSFREYAVVGTLSGTYPGTQLPGGMVLPINMDVVSDFIVTHFNTPMFQNFRSYLDMSGTGVAELYVLGPIDPVYVGETLSFAFTLINPFDFVSNPISIEIVP